MSQEVRVMFNIAARDLQTTTAKNIKFVENQSGIDPWIVGPEKLKQALQNCQLVDIPAQDEWIVAYLGTLLRQLDDAKYHVQEDRVKRIQELIDSLVR